MGRGLFYLRGPARTSCNVGNICTMSYALISPPCSPQLMIKKAVEIPQYQKHFPEYDYMAQMGLTLIELSLDS